MSSTRLFDDSEAEIKRLNKVIEALMNRSERFMGVERSDFCLFETVTLLEAEVDRRTLELERLNQALERTTIRMNDEITKRQQLEKALKAADIKFEAMSITDSLTGVANRHHFDNFLESSWRHALRHPKSLALAMIDIDYFKQYNDRYGRAQGDLCLQKIANVLQRGIRDIDLVARYGGEEFVMVLPDNELQQAVAICERIVNDIYALQEPHDDHPLSIVTVSIGVTEITPSDIMQPEQLLKQADTALYQAKSEGRNKVCTYD